MVKALRLHPRLNTKQDTQRLEAARVLLRAIRQSKRFNRG
jgi:hypothetical protein